MTSRQMTMMLIGAAMATEHRKRSRRPNRGACGQERVAKRRAANKVASKSRAKNRRR